MRYGTLLYICGESLKFKFNVSYWKEKMFDISLDMTKDHRILLTKKHIVSYFTSSILQIC